MKKSEAVAQLSIMAHRHREAQGLIREIREILESTVTGCETIDSVRYGIFAEVNAERDRQDELWGTNELYPYAPPCGDGDLELMENLAKAVCEKSFKNRSGTWVYILIEEVFEAVAAKTSEAREVELIQVMAVCSKIIEKMRAGEIPEGEAI